MASTAGRTFRAIQTAYGKVLAAASVSSRKIWVGGRRVHLLEGGTGPPPTEHVAATGHHDER
jgi:hypothetical protein